MSAPSNEDRAGYGHPPKNTQWKKGQTGNPRHRHPKRACSTVEIIDRLFMDPVEITINNATRKVSTLEAILLQLWMKEVSGDQRALSVRLKYQEFAVQHSVSKVEITFVDNDYTQAIAVEYSTSGNDHGRV